MSIGRAVRALLIPSLGLAALGGCSQPTGAPSKPAATAPAVTPPAVVAPLAWAYPYGPPPPGAPGGPPEGPPDNTPVSVPGSKLVLTEAKVDDPFNPPDWFPQSHPQMPDIVAHGRKPEVMACGLCHGVNGLGVHGAVNLAGLPAAYIVEQIGELAGGRRHGVDPARPGSQEMTELAGHVTPQEAKAAAAYFSALKFRPWIRVVETDQTPKSRGSYYGWWDQVPGTEPIGTRIVEVAEDRQRAGHYDPHSGFVAYVPTGAVTRGEALATADPRPASPAMAPTCAARRWRRPWPVVRRAISAASSGTSRPAPGAVRRWRPCSRSQRA